MRFFKSARVFALACLMALAAYAQASAQATTFVSGRVVDANQKPVPGATITLHGGNLTLKRTSDQSGRFSFFGLSVGSYSLSAQAPQLYASLNVDLTSEGVDNLTMTLLKEVAAVKSTTLRATTVRGSGTDVVFDQQRLANSTASGSVPALLLQLPGAARGANGVVHINGDHGDVNYIVDGVPIPAELDRQIGTQFDPSDISFFQAIEGAYPAQYGDHFATTINIDTKTGTGPAGVNGYVQAGSYGHMDQTLNYHTPLGGGSLAFGVRDERSNWTLDPPDYSGLHDQGSNADQYLRYTLPMDNGRNYLDFSAAHSLRTYQIPPDVSLGAPASTDDNEVQNESFASLQFHHELRTNGALTFGVSYNQSHITDYNDPSNDFQTGEALNLAGGGSPTDCANGVVTACGYSVFGDRTARDVIFNMDNVVQSAHHEVRWGAIEDVTDVQKLYNVELQPNSYLDPANIGSVIAGLPAPPDMALLANGYTCAGATGVCTVTDNAPNTGHNTQLYVQDSWRFNNNWELDYGVRYDGLRVTSAQFANYYNQISPRLKLTRFWGPRASAYIYYGRFFTPFALENVDPSAAYVLNFPQQFTVSQFDLQPQRDSDYEIGGHLPVGRGDLGIRVMQKNAGNWIDDTEVGTTALFQNINFAQGSVAVQGATYNYPLANNGLWYASVVHTMAEDIGCETQLLAPCQGGASQPFWAPADHDQRWDMTSGVTLNDHRGGWFSFDGEYGSGLTTEAAQCSPATSNCKVPPHIIFNAEKGIALGQGGGAFYVRILNLLNHQYYITFLNAQGNHVGNPREFEFGYRFGH